MRLEAAPGNGTRLTIELPAEGRPVDIAAALEAELNASEAIHG
jgi:hypothetical protein